MRGGSHDDGAVVDIVSEMDEQKETTMARRRKCAPRMPGEIFNWHLMDLEGVIREFHLLGGRYSDERKPFELPWEGIEEYVPGYKDVFKLYCVHCMVG